MKNFEKLFPDFVGNENALQQLSEQIAVGRFPHALLIEGPTGCGKKTLAKHLARIAVCSHPDTHARPCGICADCHKAGQHIHPDITLIEGAIGSKDLNVDAIRDLRAGAYILPNEAAVRVIILANAHLMNDVAQNALLKILEEPPAHVVFILTCENRAQVLSTIRSRTAVTTLGAVEWEQAKPVLTKKLPTADTNALQTAFVAAGGIIGRVGDTLNDELMQKITAAMPEFAAALASQNAWDLLAATAPFEKEKLAVPPLLSELKLLVRDALIIHYGGAATLSTAPDAAKMLATRQSGVRLMRMLEELKYLERARAHNMYHPLLLTQLTARLHKAAQE